MQRRSFAVILSFVAFGIGMGMADGRFILLAADAKPIELSAGAALAQTLPDGTVMSFGAHYEFKEGEPAADKYVWVIERAHGAVTKQNVSLKKEGMLAVVVPGWKPEDGPFHSHLEDQNGNRLSDSIELHAIGE
jgi:uncharacterized cupredoxin-like copper-binding protein